MHSINEKGRIDSKYVLFLCGNNLGFSDHYTCDQVIAAIKQCGVDVTKIAYKPKEFQTRIKSIMMKSKGGECNQSNTFHHDVLSSYVLRTL